MCIWTDSAILQNQGWFENLAVNGYKNDESISSGISPVMRELESKSANSFIWIQIRYTKLKSHIW